MVSRQQLTQTARQWIQAHNNRDADRVTALLSPDFIAHSFPSTLRDPDRNANEYAAFLSWSFTIFDTYHATETDMVADEVQNKIVYHLNVEGIAPVGDYKNEYIHKLTLTEDGKLVKAFDTFLDSQAMMAWMSKMRPGQGINKPQN